MFAPRTIDASAARNASRGHLGHRSPAFAIGNFNEDEIGSIETDVLELALGAASCAVKSGAVERPRTLTVIDYSKPSSQKRLWVYDLTTRELLYEELVAHGQGSGANLATQFSNKPDSHQTSLGLVRDRRRPMSGGTATRCGSTASTRASTIALASGPS